MKDTKAYERTKKGAVKTPTEAEAKIALAMADSAHKSAKKTLDKYPRRYYTSPFGTARSEAVDPKALLNHPNEVTNFDLQRNKERDDSFPDKAPHLEATTKATRMADSLHDASKAIHRSAQNDVIHAVQYGSGHDMAHHGEGKSFGGK